MKYIRAAVSLLLAGGLTYFLNRPLGKFPAIGSFFSPFTGFWQNAEKPVNLPPTDLKIAGLKGEVTVHYDENGVPHIFADSDEDLYFAQGFVIARDRLWQMDFYSRVGGGRLSEVMGQVALDFDKYNRRLQLPEAAERVAQSYLADPQSKLVVESYTAGVNAYIDQLQDRDMAVEYKLLGYRPEKWSPVKSALVEMVMRKDMNGRSDDFRMSNVLAKYGKGVVNELFPNYPSNESPIMPVGTKWDFKPLAVPKPAEIIKASIAQLGIEKENPAIGSNNWAVHGSRTATGLPILANDPHLGLTLPSIWYQMQLSSPTVNVYGVCVPGWPAIGIGFNKDIAWGMTNVGSDVFDIYELKFKDSTRQEYWHNNSWKKVTSKVNEFQVKGLPEPSRDTILYTHHGPIVENDKPFAPEMPQGHAVTWIGDKGVGNSVKALYLINRGHNYEDYKALRTLMSAPAFNVVFASNQNDVAITSVGQYPVKYKEQGKFIMDGSNPANDWTSYVPADHVPAVKNPARGFVSSANQFPTDQTYPYYLGWKFASSERGSRINERLSAMKNVTVDSLRLLQGDNMNIEARRVLPTLIKIAEQDATTKANPVFAKIASWNYKNDPNEVGATIYEHWVKELRKMIWEDDFPMEDKAVPMIYPTRDQTWVMIMKNPKAKWFDDASTKDKIETVNDIVANSFKATIDSLTKNYGPMKPETWAWSTVKSTDIKFLISNTDVFKPFWRKDVPNGGGVNEVNATSETGHGPSWRMVVQLDKTWPKAYGVYPGGQSGSPGSSHFENMIDTWAKGDLNELVFLKSKDEKHPKLKASMKLSK